MVAAGDVKVATATSVAGALDTLESQAVFTYALFSARDRASGEIAADKTPSAYWRQRLIDEWLQFGSDRIAVSAGRARITCPVTARQNRRPTSWIVASRLVEKTIQVDPGRVKDGALSSDVLIYDENGHLVELDSRLSSALHAARFLTLRTYERLDGVYVTRGNLMSPSGGLSRIALRAVLDVGSEVFHLVLLQQVENDLFANPLTGPQPTPGATPGGIAEIDARIIDRELYTALEAILIKPGYVSAVQVRVSRTDPFLTTGEITAKVSMTQKGYVDKATGTIGFQNPKFSALNT